MDIAKITPVLTRLRNSCLEGFFGTWDCTTEEGREGFEAMADSCELIAAALGIVLPEFNEADSVDNDSQLHTEIVTENNDEIFVPLTREEAEEKVKQYIVEVIENFDVKPAKSIAAEFAMLLLGNRFNLLVADPIRNKGPKTGTFYPWNVVDYLTNIDPRKKNQNGKQ